MPDTVNEATIGYQIGPDIAYADGAFHIVWSEVSTDQVRYRKATLTNANSIGFEGSGARTAAWPNPVSNILRVGLDWKRAVITDASGRVISETRVSSGVIDLEDLHSGWYIVRLEGPGVVSMVHVVKQ